MSDEVSVVLKGFPERVQRIADAIDQLFSGEIIWGDAAKLFPQGIIMIAGRAAPLTEVGAIDVAA